jgi:CHAT domain-containing protein
VRPSPRSVPLLLALVLLAGPPVSPSKGEETTLDDCAASVREAPEELESYRCYWALARRGQWEEASRALEALLQLDPGNHRARIFLAAVAADRGEPRAEGLYREAIQGFDEEGDTAAAVSGRFALSYVLRLRGEVPEAGIELRRALEGAEALGDPVLLARARVELANQLMSESDWGQALGLLGLAAEVVFPEGPSDLQAFVLSGQGRAYWGLGHYERALGTYERQAELDRLVGAAFREAESRYNVALLAGRLYSDGKMLREDYLDLLREALEVSRRTRHQRVEVSTLLLLGQQLEDEAAVQAFEAALAIAERIGDRERVHVAQRRLAHRRWLEGPEGRAQALSILDELAADSRERGEHEELARDLCARALLTDREEERETWLETYREAFAAVEALRELQPEGSVRARVFSRWTFPYYRYAGGLLRGLAGSPDPEGDLERAFRAIERMRARVLVEELEQAGIAPDSGETGDDAALEELLQEIAGVQRELTGSGLTSGRRAELVDRLGSLEAEESLLRDARARSRRRDFQPAASPFLGPAELADLLGENRAILSFHLSSTYRSPGFPIGEEGSWLIVVTPAGARALPLPERDEIEERVAVFLGLAARRDGREARAGESLFEDLLAEALRDLDPSVETLVLVPDGALNRLPFAALRDPHTGALLGDSFALSFAPSATLWSQWREREGEGSRSRALALADPLVGEGEEGEALRAAHPWIAGLALGPLVHTRREARALGRSLGGDSRVLVGDEASEAALKRAGTDALGVLHLAAHAVVDEQRPRRSGVLLAPGGPEEDGLLQPREIVELDLHGALVILSGCRSASGAQVSGEGVVGLARAFFRAGAHTVVGSLWPLRDDEAADLVSELARELGRGRSVSAALAAAQRSRIAAGDPVAAWAGLVVLGDGDLVPRQDLGAAEGLPPPWLGWVLGALLLLGLLALLRRRAPR